MEVVAIVEAVSTTKLVELVTINELAVILFASDAMLAIASHSASASGCTSPKVFTEQRHACYRRQTGKRILWIVPPHGQLPCLQSCHWNLVTPFPHVLRSSH